MWELDMPAKSVVSNLKLRGSYGKLGNNDVSAYGYIQTILQTIVGTALNMLGVAAATVIVKAINTAENPDNVSATIFYYDIINVQFSSACYCKVKLWVICDC